MLLIPFCLILVVTSCMHGFRGLPFLIFHADTIPKICTWPYQFNYLYLMYFKTAFFIFIYSFITSFLYLLILTLSSISSKKCIFISINVDFKFLSNFHVSNLHATVHFTIELYLCNLFFLIIFLFHITPFSVFVIAVPLLILLLLFYCLCSIYFYPQILKSSNSTFWSSNIEPLVFAPEPA